MSEVRVVLDVWAGENSMDLVARYLPKVDDCWPLAAAELAAGNLVNMRLEIAWGSLTPFDDRTSVPAAEGTLQ